MATGSLPTTVDLTGLPVPVAESIRRLVDSLRVGVPTADRPEPGARSVVGLFADQGVPTPSLEEFEAARREAWANFPREFPDPAG